MDEYAQAGVDIQAGNEVVRRIKNIVAKTHSPAVLQGIGSFGALYDLSDVLKKYSHPVLVQSVDGVGTKLMVAKMAVNYKGVGADIVNHSANDIVCMGARALTFLDYVAHEKLDQAVMEEIISGMAEACVAGSISLVGGETAEMPGVYMKGEHDVAGAITGVVEKEKIITGEAIAEGDAVIGLSSSGLHTNGYSLARKAFFDIGKFAVTDTPEGLDGTVGEVLLRVHTNYAPAVLGLLDSGVAIHGIAHITGGGFTENIPRILPKNFNVFIKKDSWPVLPVFTVIQKLVGATEEECYRAFNMGIGMVLVVPQEEKTKVLEMLSTEKEFKAYEIGEIISGSGRVSLN